MRSKKEILGRFFVFFISCPRYFTGATDAALGIGTHILGDLITSYGTMIWAPFSRARHGWGTTFIIDPWFSMIIVAGLALSIAIKRSRVPALVSVAALACYVGFQGWLRSEAIDVGVIHAAEQPSGTNVSVQPGPVSPFNWMIINERAGEYRYAFVNLVRRQPADKRRDAGFFERLSSEFDPPGVARWRTASLYGSGADAPLAREAWSRPEISFFRWFAEYPALYRIERTGDAGCAWFYDLRFFRPGSDFLPFRYGLCREEGGSWRAFQLVGEKERRPL